MFIFLVLNFHFCVYQVVLDGQASDPVPVLSSIPQGLVLGPVLFLILSLYMAEEHVECNTG